MLSGRAEDEDQGLRGDGDDDDADRHLHHRVLGDGGEPGDSGIDLHGSEAQRRGNTEQRANRGEDIDGVPDRPVDAPADHRIQQGARRQRQTVAKMEIGQREAEDNVDAPRVESPVEKVSRIA